MAGILRVIILPFYLIAGLITLAMTVPAIAVSLLVAGLAVGVAVVTMAAVVPILAAGVAVVTLAAAIVVGVAAVTKHKARLLEIIFMLIVVNTLRLWLGVFFPNHWWMDTILTVLLTLGYCWFTFRIDFHFKFTVGKFTLNITNFKRESVADDHR